MKAKTRKEIDVYAVLGVERSATWPELRRSYRARARELHPDVQAHRPTPSRLDQSRATALFTQLQQAWSLVATPELRAAYDLARVPATSAMTKPRRAAVAPAWSAGPKAGVLLRTGPGNLHIAIPGGAWDLSLAQFLRHAHDSGLKPLLIGDLPPHLELREALRAADFVERHRLTTMVGLNEPAEDRGGPGGDLDEDGVWKLDQLDRALARWARAFPARRAELPYSADLRLMGRLSVAGYEINLPHPAGIYAAVEARPTDRVEAKLRSAQPVLDVLLPPPTLALIATWAQDQEAIRALEQGWVGLAWVAQLDPLELAVVQRGLEGRRSRRDGQDALPGSVFDGGGGQLPPSILPLLRALPASLGWLGEFGGLLPQLPWGEPLSQSGDDRNLSDAAARLVGRVLDQLLIDPLEGLHLVALRGARLRYRVDSDPRAAESWIRIRVQDAFRRHLGFPASPTVARA
ncbi:MAG: DnaJ domain-containing protein [Candidatus Dormiibacterota bacterium]